MELKKIFSCYCRQLDNARMVEVLVSDGELTEVDCCFGSCIYEGSCAIAKEIQSLKEA